jgi:hypothetical protein
VNEGARRWETQTSTHHTHAVAVVSDFWA